MPSTKSKNSSSEYGSVLEKIFSGKKLHLTKPKEKALSDKINTKMFKQSDIDKILQRKNADAITESLVEKEEDPKVYSGSKKLKHIESIQKGSDIIKSLDSNSQSLHI